MTDVSGRTHMKPEFSAGSERSRPFARTTIPFDERPTCTIAEACSAVGLGRTKLYELIEGGTVDTVTIGRRRLVRIPSLLHLLAPERYPLSHPPI
jgi:excisionase family DNA binding protein